MRFIFFTVTCLSVFSCGKEASIANFKPESFPWKVDQPLFVNENNKLHLVNATDTKRNTFLYEFTEEQSWITDNVFVSPDSKFLLIDDKGTKLLNVETQKEIILLDQDGRKLLAKHSYNRNRVMQWSPNSNRFAIITKDKANEEREQINIYGIYNGKPIASLTVPEVLSFYFSKDGDRIYLKYFKNSNETSIREIRIDNEVTIGEHHQCPDEELFVNASPSDLCSHTPDLTAILVDSWDYFPHLNIKNGTYLFSKDSLRLLLEGCMSGENFKEFTSSNRVHGGSYFLPGGRYYVFFAKSKQYNGYLLLDTTTKKYQKLNKGMKFYYALNSNHFGETKDGKLNCLNDYSQNDIEKIGQNLKIIYD